MSVEQSVKMVCWNSGHGLCYIWGLSLLIVSRVYKPRFFANWARLLKPKRVINVSSMS